MCIRDRVEGHERGDQHGKRHGAGADRVDVVEMRAFELDSRRAEAKRLVDDEISRERAHPAHREIRVEAQNALNDPENAQLHKQQRQQHVEHHPDHAAGMAVGEAREEIGPRDGAGIGVGGVDLDLASDHEQQHQPGGECGVTEDFQVGDAEHGGRLRRIRPGNAALNGEVGEERPRRELGAAGDHPAGAGEQHGAPPGGATGLRAAGQKAQVIHLLAHLRQQREQDGGGHAKGQQRDASLAIAAGKLRPGGKIRQAGAGEIDERTELQGEPDRLGPELHAADGADAKRGNGHHHELSLIHI